MCFSLKENTKMFFSSNILIIVIDDLAVNNDIVHVCLHENQNTSYICFFFSVTVHCLSSTLSLSFLSHY
jgi:hypothetical protein